MLKKIIWISIIVGFPLVVYIAIQYGDLKPITIAEAMQTAISQSESEPTKKVLVAGTVTIDDRYRLEMSEGAIVFYLTDASQDIVKVVYNGVLENGALKPGQMVEVAGHMHGGPQPYFHCSKVITDEQY